METVGIEPTRASVQARPPTMGIPGNRVAGRIRTGAAGRHRPGCCPLHHGHHERRRPESNRRPLGGQPSALAAELRLHEVRGRDSNPRSRAHEAREDSLSSTAQVCPAGFEPALSGSRNRWGGQAPLQAGACELRRQGSNLRFASNSRASCRSTTPERVHGFGRSRTRAVPIKSRPLSTELRSLDVAGRDRTCGAPRFRRPLYR
jgi:hypothetical protein